MNTLQQWNRCPASIEIVDKEKTIRLTKCDDVYAIRGVVARSHLEDVDRQLPDDDISILRGKPSADVAAVEELLPVYAMSRDSTPAVATKRIFLRLAEDATVDSIREQIEALDLVIADVPAYAPHCAWLEPKSGRVDEALSKIDALRALPHTAHAEPQLLRPKGWKRGG